jgi:FkbM family methyltransferase
MTPNLTLRSFTNDQYILDKVFYSNHYRLKGNKDADKRPIIVDIGAHAGFFTFAALALGAGHVHAVEIHPSNYLQLQLNTLHASFDGLVTAYNFGIYTEVGVMGFGEPVMKENIYLDYADLHIEGNKYKRQTITLDNFLKDYVAGDIDILKLNLGYAETEILSGSSNVGNRVKSICLESSDSVESLQTFIQNMRKKGYINSVIKKVDEEDRFLILLSQDKCEKVFNIE